MTTHHRTNKTSGVQFIAVNIDLTSADSISAAENFISSLINDGWNLYETSAGLNRYTAIYTNK
jgi:hypothetical protein